MSAKTKRILKKIWNGVFTAIVVIVVLCAIFLVGTRIAGLQVFNILTDSMAPIYKVGDLVFVKSVDDIGQIKEGDDITFVLNEDLTVGTHRVIAVDEEKQLITTQGLNNETEDAPVHFKNVVGKVKFSLPMMGHVSHFIQNPPGTYITLALGALFILLVFLPDIIGGIKKAAKKRASAAGAPVDAAQSAGELLSKKEPSDQSEE